MGLSSLLLVSEPPPSVSTWTLNPHSPQLSSPHSHSQQHPQPSSMAAPLGLAALTNLSAAEPPFANDEDRAQAVGRFRRIVGHLESLEKPSTRYGDGYNRPALVRLTFDYARSQDSKDRFLVAFFQSLAIGILNDDKIDLADDSAVADLRAAVFGFAEFLMADFFLPGMPIS